VEWKDRKPADFTVNEFQSGDHVNFELKEKPHLGIHFQMGSLREPHVTAEASRAVWSCIPATARWTWRMSAGPCG
jgi:hypothetical protein